jgi:thiol-disulfide isomerase/thioredoxin
VSDIFESDETDPIAEQEPVALAVEGTGDIDTPREITDEITNGPPDEASTVADAAKAEADKPQAPRWVPAAIAIALAAGIAIGLVIGLVVGGDDEDPEVAATTSSTTATPTTAAQSASPAGDTQVDTIIDADAYGAVEIVGNPLPTVVEGAADVAIGLTVPEVAGADYDGNPVAITNDGNAKMIVFLSHWCPHCQRETPVIRDWMENTALPGNVDIYSVSTLTSADRANYPPAPWLEAEQWNIPVIADDAFDTVANAFGLHAVPFWVLVHTDGSLAGRGSGAVPPESLSEIAGLLAAGPTGQ